MEYKIYPVNEYNIKEVREKVGRIVTSQEFTKSRRVFDPLVTVIKGDLYGFLELDEEIISMMLIRKNELKHIFTIEKRRKEGMGTSLYREMRKDKYAIVAYARKGTPGHVFLVKNNFKHIEKVNNQLWLLQHVKNNKSGKNAAKDNTAGAN